MRNPYADFGADNITGDVGEFIDDSFSFNKRRTRKTKKKNRTSRIKIKHSRKRRSTSKVVKNKGKRRGMSKEFLRKLRQKHGLGEYKK